MTDLTACLERSAALQGHRCPRQVVAARMGIYAGQLLGIDVPRTDQRLLAFVELDGCFADALAAATGCSLGRRTLRTVDHGKLAATFVDADTGRAIRLAPGPGVTLHAVEHATCPCRPALLEPSLGLPVVAGPATHCASSRPPGPEEAMAACETLPATELFRVQPVTLTTPLAALLGHDRAHVVCGSCGETVVEEREIVMLGQRLCRACAGERYVVPVGPVGTGSRDPSYAPAAYDRGPAYHGDAMPRSPFAAVPSYREEMVSSPDLRSRPASGRLVSVG